MPLILSCSLSLYRADVFACHANQTSRQKANPRQTPSRQTRPEECCPEEACPRRRTIAEEGFLRKEQREASSRRRILRLRQPVQPA